MKLIDFDKKIKEIRVDLVKIVPKAEKPVVNFIINDLKLKTVLKIIADELLKDPVIVSMMAFRSAPSPQSQESFLKTVGTNIDYATAARYKELFKDIFTFKENTDVGS